MSRTIGRARQAGTAQRAAPRSESGQVYHDHRLDQLGTWCADSVPACWYRRCALRRVGVCWRDGPGERLCISRRTGWAIVARVGRVAAGHSRS